MDGQEDFSVKILVLYGTTEGQTRKVCEFIAARLRTAGDDVSLVDAAAMPAKIALADFDGAIVAASLHIGQYQGTVVRFARANHAWLNQTPSAFVSVSLAAADSDSEERKSLAECTENFKGYTGWTTAEVHHVAGAFRFTAYDFFRRWAMRLVAWEKKVKVEAGKDLELTDWDALAATVNALRARFAAGRRK